MAKEDSTKSTEDINEVELATEGNDERQAEVSSPSKSETTAALQHLVQGKRHLLVRDIHSAVNSLQEACRLLAEQYGETADPCGEAYFAYGRALLELSRIETGVLGNALDGVPEGEDADTSQTEDPEKLTEEEQENVIAQVDSALEENFSQLEKVRLKTPDSKTTGDSTADSCDKMEVIEKSPTVKEEVRNEPGQGSAPESAEEMMEMEVDEALAAPGEELKKDSDMKTDADSGAGLPPDATDGDAASAGKPPGSDSADKSALDSASEAASDLADKTALDSAAEAASSSADKDESGAVVNSASVAVDKPSGDAQKKPASDCLQKTAEQSGHADMEEDAEEKDKAEVGVAAEEKDEVNDTPMEADVEDGDAKPGPEVSEKDVGSGDLAGKAVNDDETSEVPCEPAEDMESCEASAAPEKATGEAENDSPPAMDMNEELQQEAQSGSSRSASPEAEPEPITERREKTDGSDDEEEDSEENEGEAEATEGDTASGGGETAEGNTASGGGETAEGDTASGEGEAAEGETAEGDSDTASAGDGKDGSTSQECDTEEGEEGAKQEGDDEEDVSNIQLAWEVLELAKIIFKRQAVDKASDLKLSEVYLKLGEVSIEAENYSQAVEDLNNCLQVQKKHLDADDRLIAETHYHLGVAHSLANEYSEAIESLQASVDTIMARIQRLNKQIVARQQGEKIDHADPFYKEENEIKELEDLLPDIKEKITDMRDMKAEAQKKISEMFAAGGAGPSSSAAPISPVKAIMTRPAAAPAPAEAAGEQKEVRSIGHLVKRKRPSGEVAEEENKRAKQENGHTTPNGHANGDQTT